MTSSSYFQFAALNFRTRNINRISIKGSICFRQRSGYIKRGTSFHSGFIDTDHSTNGLAIIAKVSYYFNALNCIHKQPHIFHVLSGLVESYLVFNWHLRFRLGLYSNTRLRKCSDKFRNVIFIAQLIQSQPENIMNLLLPSQN